MLNHIVPRFSNLLLKYQCKHVFGFIQNNRLNLSNFIEEKIIKSTKCWKRFDLSFYLTMIKLALN